MRAMKDTKPEKKIIYNQDGNVECELWLVNYELHREDGPARIGYNADGSVSSEGWWIDGKQHRADGPAWISYNADGSVRHEEWWIDDVELTAEEIHALKRRIVIDKASNDDYSPTACQDTKTDSPMD